jgi:hypothetical protein
VQNDVTLLERPITPSNPVVSNVAGTIIYVPSKNGFSSTPGSIYDSFDYTLSTSLSNTTPLPGNYIIGDAVHSFIWNVSIHDVLAVSSTATVSVIVNHVNQSPISISSSVMLSSFNETEPVTIQLNATKVDMSTSFAPYLFYYVNTWPQMGTLYQINQDGTV